MDRKKPARGFSKLAALAFAFIITGIIFGEDLLVGPGLIGIGVLLALIDIYEKMKQRQDVMEAPLAGGSFPPPATASNDGEPNVAPIGRSSGGTRRL